MVLSESATVTPRARHQPAGCYRLLDVSEDSVELIETVVAHDELATAAPARLDCHACTELLRQLLLESRDVRVAVARAIQRSGSMRSLQAPHECLGLTHGQSLAGHEQCNLGLLASLCEREQRARVTHLQR